MKTTTILAGIAALGALSACDSEPPPAPEQGMSPAAEPATEAAAAQPRPDPWSCPEQPGTAPSGELTPERIAAANSTREEAGLYEGPVWIDGALYFSDFTFADGFPSRIRRLTLAGEMTTAIENSGSNGLAVDNDGYLIAATHDRKAISRYNPYTGERESIVGGFDGQVFNSPNDLTMTDDGVIYFTDPDFQRSAAPGGQPATRVYRVEDGEVSVVDESVANPNGVSLSPAQDVLYVAGGGEQGSLRAYPIEDGVPGQGRDIAELTVPDGMAIDCLGNIYATEHTEQRIRVFSPEGEPIAHINFAANVTNAAFGGPERRTLYVTGAGAVWQVKLDVAGFPY